MNIEEFREYCLAKPGTEETFPFDEYALTFKVMGKMFAVTSLKEEEFRVNLKCDPEYSLELREQHHQVIPGWHMNKKHWNTVYFEDGLSEKLIRELIDHSYALVVKSLTATKRTVLQKLSE